MRKKFLGPLMALLLAGTSSVALERSARAEEPLQSPAVEEKTEGPSTIKSPPVSFTPRLGFGYRALVRSPEVDDYVDKTRMEFEGSMPGMKDFMHLGRQLPYFVVGVDLVMNNWHLLPRDKVSFTADFQFSTSAIFGGLKEEKTFDANLSAFHFGDTPTRWEQYLNFWGTLDFGVEYAPHTWGESFQFRPLIGGRIGVAYIDTRSTFSFHVNDPTIFEQYGYDTLSSLNINRDSRTDARCRGWGYNVAGYGGIELEYANFVLDLVVGYALNRFPNFKIEEHLVTNAPTPHAVHKNKTTTLEHDNSGLEGRLTIRYTF